MTGYKIVDVSGHKRVDVDFRDIFKFINTKQNNVHSICIVPDFNWIEVELKPMTDDEGKAYNFLFVIPFSFLDGFVPMLQQMREQWR